MQPHVKLLTLITCYGCIYLSCTYVDAAYRYRQVVWSIPYSLTGVLLQSWALQKRLTRSKYRFGCWLWLYQRTMYY